VTRGRWWSQRSGHPAIVRQRRSPGHARHRPAPQHGPHRITHTPSGTTSSCGD
jgi:hypothetical protein